MDEYISGVGRWKQRAMKSPPALNNVCSSGEPFGGSLMASGRLQFKISGKDIKNVLQESTQDH